MAADAASRRVLMGGKLKPGWRKVKCGDVVQLSKARCADALAEGIERHVGLEHLEPGDLRHSCETLPQVVQRARQVA